MLKSVFIKILVAFTAWLSRTTVWERVSESWGNLMADYDDPELQAAVRGVIHALMAKFSIDAQELQQPDSSFTFWHICRPMPPEVRASLEGHYSSDYDCVILRRGKWFETIRCRYWASGYYPDSELTRQLYAEKAGLENRLYGALTMMRKKERQGR